MNLGLVIRKAMSCKVRFREPAQSLQPVPAEQNPQRFRMILPQSSLRGPEFSKAVIEVQGQTHAARRKEANKAPFSMGARSWKPLALRKPLREEFLDLQSAQHSSRNTDFSGVNVHIMRTFEVQM